MTSAVLPATPLLDMMQQAVIATDLQGSITAWNSFAEEVYGWRREEVIGRRILDVVPASSYVARIEVIFGGLRRGQRWAGQFTARNRAGEEFDVIGIAAPLVDGSRMKGVVGISMPVPPPSAWPYGIDRRDTLTRREAEIATLTAEGKSSVEIGAVLHIAARTVESHRFNIYRKLGIRNRTELMMLALRHGVFK